MYRSKKKKQYGGNDNYVWEYWEYLHLPKIIKKKKIEEIEKLTPENKQKLYCESLKNLENILTNIKRKIYQRIKTPINPIDNKEIYNILKICEKIKSSITLDCIKDSTNLKNLIKELFSENSKLFNTIMYILFNDATYNNLTTSEKFNSIRTKNNLTTLKRTNSKIKTIQPKNCFSIKKTK